jgi:hypothetical protein
MAKKIEFLRRQADLVNSFTEKPLRRVAFFFSKLRLNE